MLVAPLRDPWVGAVAGNVKVANRRGLLGLIQHCEYVLATSLDRRMYPTCWTDGDSARAVGAFRRSALAEVGGVHVDTLAEDTDLTVAIGLAGWRVRYAPRARAWTEAPATVKQLWSQRHRWCYGMLQVLLGSTGAPRCRPVANVRWPGSACRTCSRWAACSAGLARGRSLRPAGRRDHARTRGEDLGRLPGRQLALTAPGFALDRERLRDLWTLPVQLVFYRQIMYLVMIHSLGRR